MNNDLICDQCGFAIVYDAESDCYIRCPCCNNVLVNVDLGNNNIEKLTIVDYGVAYGSKWIKVKDSSGHHDIYWKRTGS